MNQNDTALPGIHKGKVTKSDKGQMTRRDLILMLAVGTTAACDLQSARSVFWSRDSIYGLGKQLEMVIKDEEWWQERMLSLEDSIPARLLTGPGARGFSAARARLAEWCRASGLDAAETEVSAAWERRLAIEGKISAATAVDMRDLMVQAQILACRNWIGYLDNHRLVDSFIRGLEALRPATDRPSASDDLVLSASRDWNAAIDEFHVAQSALDEIQLPSWARGHKWLIRDPERWAAMEAEQERTGWRAAIERRENAHDRLETLEETVAQMTASSFAALLALAHPIARRLAPAEHDSVLTGGIGMAMMRSLERLGGHRTVNLHEQWYTEPGAPLMPTG